MPEGDTIWQSATRLNSALAGQTVLRWSSPVPALKEQGVEGHRITRVRAQGKYVVIELEDGRALLSFLRMQGKWSVVLKAELPAARLQRATREPRWDDENTTLVIETDAALAWLERAAMAELGSVAQIERRLSDLGPDVLSDGFDVAEACALIRTRVELTIAEALVLQSLVAGIGNVYKSEVLFLEGISPFLQVGAIDDATIERLLRRARELMRRNRRGPRRTTFGTLAGVPHYVYDRSGEHCLKCDTRIQMQRQGALQRSTYFCPTCQGVKAK